MIKKQAFLTVLKYAALLLICAGAVLQTVAMLTVYETDTNYFQSSSPLPFLSVLCVILGAVCGGAWALLTSPAALTQNPFSFSAGLVASVGFLLGGILLFLFAPTPSPATVILFFFASLYSFLSGTSFARKYPSLTALLGLLTVVSCALGNIYCYFDVSLEMNAPVKILLQVALLFSMIYYTGEVRFLLSREKKRFYTLLSFCTLAANALCGLSIPVAYFTEAFSRADYFALSAVASGLMISLLIRILSPKKSPESTDATDADIATHEEISPFADPASLSKDDTEESKETDEE